MRIRFSLLRFGRPPRADPVLPVPSPVDIRPLPSPNTDTGPDYPDRATALSQWQRLGTLDQKSYSYIDLLKSLVDVEGNRNLALELTNGDADVVINNIDWVSPFSRLYRCYTPYPSTSGSEGRHAPK